jgi:hypothetical protein
MSLLFVYNRSTSLSDAFHDSVAKISQASRIDPIPLPIPTAVAKFQGGDRKAKNSSTTEEGSIVCSLKASTAPNRAHLAFQGRETSSFIKNFRIGLELGGLKDLSD